MSEGEQHGAFGVFLRFACVFVAFFSLLYIYIHSPGSCMCFTALPLLSL